MSTDEEVYWKRSLEYLNQWKEVREWHTKMLGSSLYLWYSNTHITVLSVAYVVLENQHPWTSEGFNEKQENLWESLHSKSPKGPRVKVGYYNPPDSWCCDLNMKYKQHTQLKNWAEGSHSSYHQTVTLCKNVDADRMIDHNETPKIVLKRRQSAWHKLWPLWCGCAQIERARNMPQDTDGERRLRVCLVLVRIRLAMKLAATNGWWCQNDLTISCAIEVERKVGSWCQHAHARKTGL